MSTSKTAGLLVDPDPLMFTIFQRLGRGLGLRTTYAPNAERARAELDRSRFDIAFLEPRQPDFATGHSLLLDIRSEHPSVPVAIVSGSASPEERAATMRAGIVAHLPKPFGTEALAQILISIGAQNNEPAPFRPDAPDDNDLAALPSAVRRFAERFANRRATAILAARYDNATNSDIATRLGISETTVKRTLNVTFFAPLDARFADLEEAAAAWLERRHGTAESPKAHP